MVDNMKLIELDKQFEHHNNEIIEALNGELSTFDKFVITSYIASLQFDVLHQQKVINRLSRKIQNKNRKIYKLENRLLGAIEYMEHYIKVEELNEPVKVEFKEVLEILRGKDEN